MKATLEIECKDPEIFKRSLEPDIEKKKNININIKTKDNTLIIEIEAEKLSHLKAVINTYLSLVNVGKELEGVTWPKTKES